MLHTNLLVAAVDYAIGLEVRPKYHQQFVWIYALNCRQCSVSGTDFSYEECQEVPNVIVAAIGLAVLTLACAIFICRPLHPLLARVLPSIGAGAAFSSQHGTAWLQT